MSQYFQDPKSSGERMKVELDLPNYIAKADLKNGIVADTWKFAKEVHLTNLRSDVDKLDIDQLRNVTTNLKPDVDKLDIDQLKTVKSMLNS